MALERRSGRSKAHGGQKTQADITRPHKFCTTQTTTSTHEPSLLALSPSIPPHISYSLNSALPLILRHFHPSKPPTHPETQSEPLEHAPPPHLPSPCDRSLAIPQTRATGIVRTDPQPHSAHCQTCQMEYPLVSKLSGMILAWSWDVFLRGADGRGAGYESDIVRPVGGMRVGSWRSETWMLVVLVKCTIR
jgi:hypothetical protein